MGAIGALEHHRGGWQRCAFYDPVIQRIRDIKIARGVDAHAGRLVEQRAVANAIIIAGVAGNSANGGDHAESRYAADRVVAAVGDIKIVRGVHGNAFRKIEAGDRAGAIRGAGGRLAV